MIIIIVLFICTLGVGKRREDIIEKHAKICKVKYIITRRGQRSSHQSYTLGKADVMMVAEFFSPINIGYLVTSWL